MSSGECSSAKQRGVQRYKGVENFLKRIAFNLGKTNETNNLKIGLLHSSKYSSYIAGNTPSQTEVKIISCIPIDVSDLQQKIAILEKQLEESKLVCNAHFVNTVLCDAKYPPVSNTGVSCNTLDVDRNTSPCEETNMFNKSNASISPPPVQIDKNNPTSSNKTEGYTNEDKRVLDIMDYEKSFAIGESKPNEGRKSFFKKKKKSYKQKKPKSHYIYYAQTGSPFYNSDIIEEAPKNDIGMSHSYLAKMIDKQYKPKPLGKNLSVISQFSWPVCRDIHEDNARYVYESDVCSCCHIDFQNIDKHLTASNNPQIYRADNIRTDDRFYDSNLYDVIPVKEKPVKVKKVDVPKKRVEPDPSIDIMCWPEDVRTKLRTYRTHNPFPSPSYLDYHTILPKKENIVTKTPKLNRREPVVKNIVKYKNNMDRQINMEMSKSSCIDFGNVYPKIISKKRIHKSSNLNKDFEAVRVCKVDVECLTTATNNSECQTVTSHNDSKDSNPIDDKTEQMLNQIKTMLQSVLQEVKDNSLTKSLVDEHQKKNANIQKEPSQDKLQSSPQSNIMQNSLQGTLLPSILPVNMQNNLQSNMHGSRLLNSFTYSPYNVNPYIASCSKQASPNQCYYPQSPVKCFHNYPLFINSPGRQTCNCYRHDSHLKSSYGRHATTIATNTDKVKTEHNKETEKLIKEIYKSMALNIEDVKKVHSNEFDPGVDLSDHIQREPKPTAQKPASVKESRKVTNVVQAVSELFRKKDLQLSSDSPNLSERSKYESNNTTESKYGTRNEGMNRSRLATTTNTDIDMEFKKQKADKIWNQSKGVPKESRQVKQKFNTGTNTMSTVSGTDTSTSETDVEEERAKHVDKERKEKKKSLFSKMFSVKLFKSRERKKRDKKDNKVETPVSDESSSDSDDYQTIYSHKIEPAPKQRLRPQNLSKRRIHSKISYKHSYQRDKSREKYKKLPYMEQEYRRHWNEKLMFQDNRQQRHSSDPYYTRDYLSRSVRKPTSYYQTYEARTALIEPRTLLRVGAKSASPKTISSKLDPKLAMKGVAWLKQRKVRCGQKFKKMIIEG